MGPRLFHDATKDPKAAELPKFLPLYARGPLAC
jgi:hypothetical protein